MRLFRDTISGTSSERFVKSLWIKKSDKYTIQTFLEIKTRDSKAIALDLVSRNYGITSEMQLTVAGETEKPSLSADGLFLGRRVMPS